MRYPPLGPANLGLPAIVIATMLACPKRWSSLDWNRLRYAAAASDQ